jgi:hypothetical protein
MTPEDVAGRVDHLRTLGEYDDEAHMKEDALHDDVLRHIAAHSIDPRSVALATEALKSTELHFHRWYG